MQNVSIYVDDGIIKNIPKGAETTANKNVVSFLNRIKKMGCDVYILCNTCNKNTSKTIKTWLNRAGLTNIGKCFVPLGVNKNIYVLKPEDINVLISSNQNDLDNWKQAGRNFYSIKYLNDILDDVWNKTSINSYMSDEQMINSVGFELMNNLCS